MKVGMRCIKLLGERIMARDFDRQDAKVQIRYTSLGHPRPSACTGDRREKATSDFKANSATKP